MIGYLFTRWGQIGWSTTMVIVTSAIIRGTYHLYQGFGAFIGNAVMGVIFALFFWRTKRVMPLIIAHFLLDAVGFLAGPLLF